MGKLDFQVDKFIMDLHIGLRHCKALCINYISVEKCVLKI